ncbi:MAG: electron transport complex subunit E [Gemmatimonadota bacterium]
MRATTPQQDFLRGIWEENPVLVQLLGLCPALAVTNTVLNSLAMAGATLFVLLGSSFLVALLKNLIPHEVRISTYILIIATFVTIVDMVLAAEAPRVHAELGAFIALIVVNCMILGRQEAFASKRPVGRALLDALGTGAGFGIAMVMMGTFREVLGSGTLGEGTPWVTNLFGPNYEPWVIMISPPGGFFTLGFILLFMGWWKGRKAQKKEIRHWAHSLKAQAGKEAA